MPVERRQDWMGNRIAGRTLLTWLSRSRDDLANRADDRDHLPRRAIIQALYLPSVHVWACEVLATSCALRFAAIFPEMCLSLTLLTVPCNPEESRCNLNEIVQSWCYAQELGTVEHALMNVVTALCGQDVNLDLEDDLIAHLEIHYPPFRRTIVSHLGCLIADTLRPAQEILSCITQPVLLIHGDSNDVIPTEGAFIMQEQLVNAKDGAKLYLIRGAQGFLGVVPESASIANRVFASFLSPLNRLAGFMHDPDIASRDLCSPMAFSCVPPSVVLWRAQIFARAAAGHRYAFSPLDSNGRPTRRYSERLQEQWFEVDRNGMSYSAQSEEARARRHASTLDERLEALSEMLAEENAVARIRRIIPRVPPQAVIECVTLSSGLSSRFTSTANLAARVMHRLPV
ncbi:hypothetical protein B0F90DRAFT_1726542 [Multifurca ochricompacta]|uniref:Uncharacterized protein n=1 Tax=Multifurca ochricompacta TaxID=376703 RepID=A0AAD4M385_9AGAM|nr:hypothetical protein B0F90DRAFT_1726542 [Multifurca ochricompacta]